MPRPATAVLLALGLALAACGGGDDGAPVTPERFRADVADASGLRADIADCVADDLLASVPDDELADFYGEEGSDLSPAHQELLDAAVRRCTTEAITPSLPPTTG